MTNICRDQALQLLIKRRTSGSETRRGRQQYLQLRSPLPYCVFFLQRSLCEEESFPPPFWRSRWKKLVLSEVAFMELKGRGNKTAVSLIFFLLCCFLCDWYSHTVFTLEARSCVMHNRMCIGFLCWTVQVLLKGFMYVALDFSRMMGLYFKWGWRRHKALTQLILQWAKHISKLDLRQKHGLSHFPPLSGLCLGKAPWTVSEGKPRVTNPCQKTKNTQKKKAPQKQNKTGS